ncbi:AbrB/MazE/SpoVT family DNA-binding domain-containing protein [Pusillimonas sp. MFBS29]|uniref:AbrB/MazE/SpoVT family DNA-binding domain-containing protein n=1 Tax=Pusillimonas sp. MFBS29 TaxID=2886690 RepID=UPI001D1046DC|nr:AbrB/MazE/SpoVT family DNA-binding domain-containing protein [Pusillimonas sp. MFBS29]MCC2597021.1 AbrB/MazE/SpoVT family DNA-binding domain-containing protein [Pusillimonas sp. MFBS29]
MADATTLTSKGQVTVPKEIRQRMGLKPGDRIAFSLLSDGTLVVRPKVRRVTDLAGLLHQPGQKPVPLQGMTVDLTVDDAAS